MLSIDKLASLTKTVDDVEEECGGLKKQLKRANEEHNKVLKEYDTDRDKIANALRGFDREMTNADIKLRGVLDELEKEKMKSEMLNEAQIKMTSNVESERNILKEQLNESTSQLILMRKKYEANEEEVTKVRKDIGVYEEAIKMLQKQVGILEELANSAQKSVSKAGIEDFEERLRRDKHELTSRIHAEQLEHDSVLRKKNSHIADLQEQLHQRDAATDRLEHTCSRAHHDLDELRQQKKHLEARLDQATAHLHRIKYQPYSVATDNDLLGIADGVKVAAEGAAAPRSKRELFDVNDVCTPLVDTTLDRQSLHSYLGTDLDDNVCTPLVGATLDKQSLDRNLGTDLDELLNQIRVDCQGSSRSI